MTNRIQFSEIQLINLSALLAIRDGIKRDRVSTCCQFGISSEAVTFIEALSTDRIVGIVANFGNECLFPPRHDLIRLLQLPLPLTGPVAAVHPPQQTIPPSLQARSQNQAIS